MKVVDFLIKLDPLMKLWAVTLAIIFLIAPLQGRASLSKAPHVRVQLENALKKQLAERMNLEADIFEVHVDQLTTTPALAPTAQGSIEVLGLGTEGARRLDGLMALTLNYRSNEGALSEIRAQALVRVVGPVWVAKKNLNRGQTVMPDDLKLERLSWKTLPTGAAGANLQDLKGRRVSALIQAGDPVFPMQLAAVPLVETGDAVALTIHAGGGVIIRAKAIAKQPGGEGDVVRMEQPDTKKVLIGTVVGRKEVEVRL